MRGTIAPQSSIEHGSDGIAPCEWPNVPLGECCRVVNGTTPAADDDSHWKGDVVWVTPTDLGKLEGAYIRGSARTISRNALDSHNLTLCPPGSVVLSSRAPIGHLGIAAVPLCTNQGCKTLVPRNGVRPEYLYYALLRAVPDLKALGSGATFAEVSKAQVEGFAVPLPPLGEQERIASRLTAELEIIERARAAAAQRLAAADALPASLLREVFGDPPPFDASPLSPTAPTQPGWEWHRLTSLARLATGHTPSRRCPEYWNGEIPWIQLPDIRALDGRTAMETLEHTNALGIANSAAVRLPAGTVCLSRTASIGFVTIMGREMATSQDFVNWVCGPDLDPSFLMHLFIACRKPIRDLGSGATHHTIYFPTVEQFAVCVPSLATQCEIVATHSARLAAAEALISRCRQELADIEALPAALLREAFEGAHGA